MNAEVLPRASCCIYCGASNATGYLKPLSTEHIVPLALNGDLILPDASCERCQKITGTTEQIVLRGHYRGLRIQQGWKHRKKNEQPTELPIFLPDPAGGRDIRRMVPLAEYPYVSFFFDLPTPGILIGILPEWEYGLKYRWLRLQATGVDPPVTSENLTTFSTPSLDLHSFCRMIAKIAHAFAAAKVGLHSFVPLLEPIILGNATNFYHFVGGFPGATEMPIADKPYEISLSRETCSGRTYLVAKIRLFANVPGSRAYQAVVGKIASSNEI
ncbi:hypothetical protein ACQR13_27765 [Bradyrhizobium sp. HKCCYLRH3059]|uniref:hypothetical protein n=1 Tax=Bradyrhizobium sp. HKCCYLRH3059 TaxID=3420745 RepID=UPI003EC0A5FE